MKNKLFLLSELLRRDLAARYAGSFGGPLWAVLNPAVVCAVYAVVFAVFLKQAAPPGFRGGYVEFLLAGLLPWLGVQEAVMRATGSVSGCASFGLMMSKSTFELTNSSIAARWCNVSFCASLKITFNSECLAAAA